MSPVSTVATNYANPSYRYYNVVLIPIVATALIGQGLWALPFIFFLTFVVHSTIDTWLVTNNFETKLYVPRSTEKHNTYMAPVYLSVFVQLVVTVCAIIYPYESFDQVLTTGIVTGISGGIIGLSAGHELIHGNTNLKRKLGLVILLCINYPHFAIEHLLHHKNLATPIDSDVARPGENIYRFIIRAIPYGWYICWKYEEDLFREKRMWKLVIIQILIFIGIGYFFGQNAVMMFAICGISAIGLLKWLDYVQHYGIERKVIDGKLEPISRKHAWDSISFFTNFTIFNIGHHAHHHQQASIVYYRLEKHPEATNTLNRGYTGLMLLSLYPKKYYEYMEPFIQRNIKK